MKIDERIMAGSILISERNGGGRSFRGLRQIPRIERRVPAGRSFAIEVIAHVFHVAAPGLADGVELVGKSLDRRGIDAAVADGLAIWSCAGEYEVRIDLAVV